MNQTEFFLENDISAEESKRNKIIQNIKIAALLLVTALTLLLRQTGAGKPTSQAPAGTPDNPAAAKKIAGIVQQKQ